MSGSPGEGLEAKMAPSQGEVQEVLRTRGQTPSIIADLAYRLIRLLFRFVLTLFFGNIIVEGLDNLSPDGQPTLLLANHSNSLTDALIVMASVPRKKRRRLRMTAKATHFRRGTFSSWLIEKAGSVPLMRQKDYDTSTKVDNSAVLALLHSALDSGDAVAIFPEGISRYHPSVAPLKTGFARIAAEVLSRARDRGDEGFALDVVTCSITYLHRQHFRSDVLVSFNPPLTLRASKPADPLSTALALPDESSLLRRDAIRRLTDLVAEQIRAGTLDAPSWKVLRVANTARRLYAPLGTQMALGEHVRLTQRFVDALSGKRAVVGWKEAGNVVRALRTPMAKDPAEPNLALTAATIANGDGEKPDYFSLPKTAGAPRSRTPSIESVTSSIDGGDIESLIEDLKAYQDDLVRFGIKDDRVRNNRLLHRSIIVKRLVVRLVGAACLLGLSVPGLVLWMPVFVVAKWKSEAVKRKGPVWDTYDEITQTKLVWGLAMGIGVYVFSMMVTLPLLPVTFWGVPLLMWLTLRWTEDMVSSARAAVSLTRMLLLGPTALLALRARRESLHLRVVALAVDRCGLPPSSDSLLEASGGAGRRQRWRNALGYFSVRRRRKRDYNEVLRLFDIVDFPEDEEPEGPPTNVG